MTDPNVNSVSGEAQVFLPPPSVPSEKEKQDFAHAKGRATLGISPEETGNIL